MADAPPEQPNPFSSPSPVQAQLVTDAATGDATGGVIPYKNMPALFAYYCGIFSLIPLLGLVLGPVAFILGIVGLNKRKRQPEVKGSAHAWIGIVLGGLVTLAYGALVVLAIVGSMA